MSPAPIIHRHFAANASAVALAVHLRKAAPKPGDKNIDLNLPFPVVNTSCALPPDGGSSRSSSEKGDVVWEPPTGGLGQLVNYEAALAETMCDPHSPKRETEARLSLRRLVIGRFSKLEISGARLAVKATHGGRTSTFQIAAEELIGAYINEENERFPFEVKFAQNPTVVNKHKSRYKLATIFQQGAWLEKVPPQTTTDEADLPMGMWPPPKRVVRKKGPKDFDRILRITGFGAISFGEVFMTDRSRRVTLVRLKLGSPLEGDGTIGFAYLNGVEIPPRNGAVMHP